jgi:hypothetical protein
MDNLPSRARRTLPVALGVVTLAGVAVLFAWDAWRRMFPARAHEVLAAFPLAMIAVAYLVYRAGQRPARGEILKAALLAAAFLLWAANQFWPDLRAATLFNDGAIGLFVLDVFLVIVGWPAGSPDGSLAKTGPHTGRKRDQGGRRCELPECCSVTCRRCGC